MTFGRWLLIHSFSIFLVGLLLFGYVYRNELQLEQAYQQLLKLEPPIKDSSQSIATTQSRPETIQTTTPEIVKPATVSPTSSAKNDQKPMLKMPLASIPTVSKQIIQQDERLMTARKAYWDKNYTLAIRHYQQLIQENNNNPDHLGELGNVYYALNDNQNAASAYFQAALLLLEQKKPQKARLLISPITAMNRELGNQLKQNISNFYRSE